MINWAFFIIFVPVKRILKIIVLFIVAYIPLQLSAQTYIKINAPYAFFGIINMQAEFPISNHSSISYDVTYSPWKSYAGKHLNFGIAMGEYRYFFKKATNGWYLSANAGMAIFDMHRPQFFVNGRIFSRQNQYGKGFGVMTGLGVGWEHHLGDRWLIDMFVSLGKIWSWYNRYENDGTIIMHPQGHEHYDKPDPFNGSVEVMPIKLGVSIGYKVFDPNRRER